jgi:addiction module HigA family antidote
MATRFHPPIHPGEILREEFMEPNGLKAYTLAKLLNVQRARIERIVAEKNPITTDTALRLAKLFNTTPEFWINMQTAFDLSTAEESVGAELEAIIPLKAKAA